MDNDEIVLEDAKDAAFAIDKAYRRAVRRADLDAMAQLKPQVDAAFDAYSRARLRLLQEDVVCTDEDVAEMRKLKAAIDQAAQDQQMVEGAIRFAGFLAKFV